MAFEPESVRRSTRSGRNTAGRSRIGTTSRSRAGWRRRSASSKAARGGSRIRSSAPTGWRRSSRTTGRCGSSGWPRRPPAYAESPCCRAPFLPLLTRDVRESGLICQHCNETLVPFEEIPAELRAELDAWAQQYEPVHAVAHWDDRQRRRAGNYDAAYENAAEQAEQLLARAGRELAPKLLDAYAAVIWEDQDECLEVRPEDVPV